MLLVGSFEPFDEEEARRVGANDTLTKPFQSIRRLIEKVGLLSSNRPPEEQIPTAELPHAEESPVEKLTTAELEITTADTRPLPPELTHVIEAAAASQAQAQAQAEASRPAAQAQPSSQGYEGAGEVLLDLGDYRTGHPVLDDEFVLDIDLDESPEPSPTEPAFSGAPSPSRESYRSLPKIQPSYASAYGTPATISSDPAPSTDNLQTPIVYERVVDDEIETAAAQVDTEPLAPPSYVPLMAEAQPEEQGMLTDGLSPAAAQPVVQATQVSAQTLSPEMIDAIARRAVEYLSEKVIQEIAWEVVPQLAELLIKRQLEEKNS